MKGFVFLLAVALALPLATAFNCNELNSGDRRLCNSIQQSSLSSIEKDLLIADIFNPTNTFPNHDFIYSWNLDLDITEPSNGIKENKGTIRNAWIRAVAPMPSVLENDTLYVPERGKLLSEYNYEVKLPTHKQKYDCKTKYSLRDQDEYLKIYLDGKYIGGNKLASFIISGNDNEEVILKAKLEVRVEYKVKHYRRRNGRCRYSYREYITDTLTVSDTINAKLQKFAPENSFEIINKYHGSSEGYLQAGNVGAVELSFENSVYQKTNYIYRLNYTPDYILTLRAERAENTKVSNMHVDDSGDKINFVVKDASNCQIRLSTHFANTLKSCNLDYNEVNFEIKTDKLNYHEGDVIQVEILPSNLDLTLIYANQSIATKGSAKFMAMRGQNKIIAQLNNKQSKRFINVIDEENEIFLKQLTSISFCGYIVFSFLRKYYASFSLI